MKIRIRSFKPVIHIFVILCGLASYNSQVIESEPWNDGRRYNLRPIDYMVDLTNYMGLNVLYEHNFLNENNIAFSPYGLSGILVALYEGVEGSSSNQIRETLGLPIDRNVLRVGFRDIHRRLRSYFIPKEGFLAGLAFNNDNVTFKQEYKDVLQFYGYDFEIAPPQTTERITTTSMSRETTSPAGSTAPEIDVSNRIMTDSDTTTFSTTERPSTTPFMTTSTLQDEIVVTTTSQPFTLPSSTMTFTADEDVETTTFPVTQPAIVSTKPTTAETKPPTESVTEAIFTTVPEALTTNTRVTRTTQTRTTGFSTTNVASTNVISTRPGSGGDVLVDEGMSMEMNISQNSVTNEMNMMPIRETTLTDRFQPTAAPETVFVITDASTQSYSTTARIDTTAKTEATTRTPTTTRTETPTVINGGVSGEIISTSTMASTTQGTQGTQSTQGTQGTQGTERTTTLQQTVTTNSATVKDTDATTQQTVTSPTIQFKVLQTTTARPLPTSTAEPVTILTTAKPTITSTENINSAPISINLEDATITSIVNDKATQNELTTVKLSIEESTETNSFVDVDVTTDEEKGSVTLYMTTEASSTDPTSEKLLNRKKKSLFHYNFPTAPQIDHFEFYRPNFLRNPTYETRGLQYQRAFLANGFSKVQINYMTYESVLEFAYIPYLKSLALKLPLDTSEYYLLILLPEYEFGVNQLIKDLHTDRSPSLKQINYMLTNTYVRAWVPSFTLKGFVVLTSDLQKLGICDAFEPRQDDFKPMTNEKNIYVRNIEQAITVTIRKYMEPGVKKRYVQNQPPVEFAATHPFLYFVMDSAIHVSLMAGKIVNPLNSRIL